MMLVCKLHQYSYQRKSEHILLSPHCDLGMYQGSDSDYSKKQLENVKNGTANLTKFVIKNGRKYYKIMQHEFDTFRDRNEYREGSVHAFVDKNTGEVYKPASYNAPAKHVRYDLRIINDRAKLHDPRYTGWSGGYLYMR